MATNSVKWSSDHLYYNDKALAYVEELGVVTVGNSSIAGSTGQYLTLGAAITAGFSNIKVVGSTLETGNIDLTNKNINVYADTKIINNSGLQISFNINMATYVFTPAPNSFTAKNLLFTFAYSVASKMFIDNGGYGTRYSFEDITIVNNSTVAGCYFLYLSSAQESNLILKNIIYLASNTDTQGFYLQGVDYQKVDNIQIYGNSASCGRCFTSTGGYNLKVINDVMIFGTFSSSLYAFYVEKNLILTNIKSFNGNGGLCFNMTTGSPSLGTFIENIHSTSTITLNGFYQSTAQVNNIKCDTLIINEGSTSAALGRLMITNLDCNTLTMNVTSNNYIRHAEFTNCIVKTAFNDHANNLYNHFINCLFYEVVTVNAIAASFVNSHFLKGLTIAADDCDINTCKIGTRGTATYKLTINAGVNDCNVMNLRTELATVDNGTGTVNFNEKIW